MPAAIAGAAAAAASIFGAGAAAAVGNFVLGVFSTKFIGSVIIGGLTSVLAGKLAGRKRPDFGGGFAAEARSRTQVIRSAVQPGRIVYGRARLSGPLAFADATGGKKEYLHLVVLLACHECQEIGSVFLGDEEILPSQINSSGAVIGGKFAGLLRIKKHLGAADQRADAQLAADCGAWTSAHRLRGITYLYLRPKYNARAFPGGIPNISAIVRGKKLYDPRSPTAAAAWSPNPVLAVRDYLTSPRGLNASASEIDDTSFVAAANVCDEFVVLNEVRSSFTVDDDDDILTLDAKGAKFYLGDRLRITTTVQPPGGLVTTRDYFAIPHGGTRIKLATSHANAIVGTAINITSEGSGTLTAVLKAQPRYDLNGVVSLGDTPRDIIEDLLTSCGGALVYSGGKYRLYPASATTPSADIDDSWLRGGFAVAPRAPRADLFNEVRGTFVDPSRGWQPTDFPPVKNSIYRNEDGGETLTRDIELPCTTNAIRSQRLAKMHLERARQAIVVELKCNLKALPVRAWDVVRLTLPEAGWTHKQFRVTGWLLNGEAGVDLTLREESSTVYDWVRGAATDRDPAPNTELQPALTVRPPTNLQLNGASAKVGRDGTVHSQVIATWTAPADAYVRNIEIAWKLRDATSWDYETLPAETTEFIITGAIDGENYDVAVRSVNSLGLYSDSGSPSSWTTRVMNVRADGTSRPPGTVTGFTAKQVGTDVVFSWVDTMDPDLHGYEIKYMAAPFVWATATRLSRRAGGTTMTVAGVPHGDWIFGIKALNTSALESRAAATVALTVSRREVFTHKTLDATGEGNIVRNIGAAHVSADLIKGQDLRPYNKDSQVLFYNPAQPDVLGRCTFQQLVKAVPFGRSGPLAADGGEEGETE